MLFENYAQMMLALSAIIAGLTQVFKKWILNNEPLQDRLCPTVAVAMGILLGGLLSLYHGEDIVAGIMSGIVAGLSAIGLYVGVKKISGVE